MNKMISIENWTSFIITPLEKLEFSSMLYDKSLINDGNLYIWNILYSLKFVFKEYMR